VIEQRVRQPDQDADAGQRRESSHHAQERVSESIGELLVPCQQGAAGNLFC
jgi:hypothetical protein